jgi:hypothetical protein
VANSATATAIILALDMLYSTSSIRPGREFVPFRPKDRCG